MPDASSTAVGLLVNPMSGRDVRRLAARASTTTPEIKRDQVARAAVGAVAGGAKRLLITREPFRIAESALENLRLDAEVEILDLKAELQGGDSERAARAMQEAGCGSLLVLGGDGTSRRVAKSGCSLPLVALSTGTNNVFPVAWEATSAGMALGLVAAGRVPLAEVSRPAKCVHVELEGHWEDLALVDAVFLADDSLGNLMPFDPERLRALVLARAEPSAVGTSPIGGLLEPCGAGDDFGVGVRCGQEGPGREPLLAPISPGLFRIVHVSEGERLAFGEVVEWEGPGILAFDGDRERELEAGQRAWLRVERDGPRVIDVARALESAARSGAFRGRLHWHDALVGAKGLDCC